MNKCKEKWKNLRTTFVRSMKIPPSGSKAKKPYYLNDAMQFTIPFLKSSVIPSGNLPLIPSDENVESTDTWENNSLLDISDITESSEIQDQPHSPQLETVPMPPPPSTPTQSRIQHSSQPEQAENQKLTKKLTIPVMLIKPLLSIFNLKKPRSTILLVIQEPIL